MTSTNKNISCAIDDNLMLLKRLKYKEYCRTINSNNFIVNELMQRLCDNLQDRNLLKGSKYTQRSNRSSDDSWITF